MGVLCRTSLLLSLLALLFGGCAGSDKRVSDASSARATARVAVLPSTWATEASLADADASAALARGLSRSEMLDATAGGDVSRALEGRPSECNDDPDCARAVGRDLHVDQVAALSLARLGTTVMVRVRLVEVVGSAGETSRQAVVQDATAESVEAAAFDIGQELAPARPHESHWYQKWWLWTLVAAVVGGGIAAGVVLTRDQGQSPDLVITPP